jgi:hypothetical protein
MLRGRGAKAAPPVENLGSVPAIGGDDFWGRFSERLVCRAVVPARRYACRGHHAMFPNRCFLGWAATALTGLEACGSHQVRK